PMARRWRLKRAYRSATGYCCLGFAQDDRAPARGDQGGFRSGNLVRGGTAYLANPFEQIVHAMDVTLAEQTAMRVHRQRTARADMAFADEVLGFARTAKSMPFEGHEDDRREVLIDHGDIDIARAETAVLPQLRAHRRRFMKARDVPVMIEIEQHVAAA